MGMYTELVLKFEISKNLPKDVMQVFEYLFNNGEEPSFIPDHEFFKKSRWFVIGKSSSFYHHPECVKSWCDVDYSDTIYIFSRSDLKDYNNEIQSFVDWAKPYIRPSTGDCLGWVWYEEEDAPTLIINGEKL